MPRECEFQKCPYLLACLGSNFPREFIAKCEGCGDFFFTANGHDASGELAGPQRFDKLGCWRHLKDSKFLCDHCWNHGDMGVGGYYVF